MTKADEARDAALRRLGCICCIIHGLPTGGPVDKHHLVDKGYREHSGGEQATIPLCRWHHRGEPVRMDLTVRFCTQMFGPSLAVNKRAFIRRWGTERELLEMVDQRLKRSAAGHLVCVENPS
jgi:hypothetical protein